MALSLDRQRPALSRLAVPRGACSARKRVSVHYGSLLCAPRRQLTSRVPRHTTALAGACCIPVSDPTRKFRGMLLGALSNLSMHVDNKVAIASAGGIPPLIALLWSPDVEVQEYSAAG